MTTTGAHDFVRPVSVLFIVGLLSGHRTIV